MQMIETYKENGIAVIVAPDRQGLQKIFGIPAIRRVALLCSLIGYKEIHIIGVAEHFQPVLSDLVGLERFHPASDLNSMAEIARAIAGDRRLEDTKRILILRSDLIIDRANLLKLVCTRSDICYMEVEGSNYRIFLTSARHLVPVLEHSWSPGNYFEIFGEAFSVKGSNGLPCAINGFGRDKNPEARLVNAIRNQTKGTDGFLSRRVSRHVSLFMSVRLALTPIRPNHVTLLGAGIGLLGALFIAKGDYLNQLIGSMLFLFCIIVDGVDGEIARLKLQESTFGHNLDIIADNVVHVAIFTGLGIGSYFQTGQSLYLHLLWIMLGGFFLSGTVVHYRILKCPPNSGSNAITRIMTLMSNRDFAYLMVFLAVLGRLHWFLIGASIGSYIFAIILWISTNRRDVTLAEERSDKEAINF